MSRGKRPTASDLDARSRLPGEPRRDARDQVQVDDEPPSGVIFRCDVFTSVPRLAVPPAALKGLPLDHRAGFIMSFVDGTFTVEMILDACAMKREEALGILRDLVGRGIIAI